MLRPPGDGGGTCSQGHRCLLFTCVVPSFDAATPPCSRASELLVALLFPSCAAPGLPLLSCTLPAGPPHIYLPHPFPCSC